MATTGELAEAVARLHALLEDPHPGLAAWREDRLRGAQRVRDLLIVVADGPPGVTRDVGQGVEYELDRFSRDHNGRWWGALRRGGL